MSTGGTVVEEAGGGSAVMDSLSDELLLRVLRLVGPEALLREVPLVCRRWRRLALDPRIWSRVCLAYEEINDKPWQPDTRPRGDVLWLHVTDRKRCVELHRALRRVPCLLRLQCSLRLRPPPNVLAALAAAARVPLEALALHQVPTSAVLPLLDAHAARLRVLEWRMPEKDFSWKAEIKAPGPKGPAGLLELARRERAIWDKLAAMRLTELVVDWTWPSRSFGHDFARFCGGSADDEGERLRDEDDDDMAGARGGTSSSSSSSSSSSVARTPPSWRLTKFILKGPDTENLVLPWQRDVVWPGIAAAVATLRELRLCWSPLVLRDVVRCRGLRSITLPVVRDLKLLLQCTQLQSLHLLGNYGDLVLVNNDWERNSVMFLTECARRGVPRLTRLVLDGFNKGSTEELPLAVALLASLEELTFLSCEIRACDNTWFQLTGALRKLTALRKLVIGHASSIPRGGLRDLGDALPPGLQWLRLDGVEGFWSFGSSVGAAGGVEAGLRRIVAGQPGLHGCLTQPSRVCGERCEEVHAGLCGSKLLVNHGARKPRRRDACPLCAPALRYKGSTLTEVAAEEAELQHADEEDSDDDPDGDLEDEDMEEEGDWVSSLDIHPHLEQGEEDGQDEQEEEEEEGTLEEMSVEGDVEEEEETSEDDMSVDESDEDDC